MKSIKSDDEKSTRRPLRTREHPVTETDAGACVEDHLGAITEMKYKQGWNHGVFRPCAGRGKDSFLYGKEEENGTDNDSIAGRK